MDVPGVVEGWSQLLSRFGTSPLSKVLQPAIGYAREGFGVHETVARDRKVAGSAHVCIDGVENEALLFLLDEAGVCASAASACASGAMEPSHVLAAMGVPRERALGALRLTLGRTTTDGDVDLCAHAVVQAVRRLRAAAT